MVENINVWINGAKDCLTETRMAKDEPGHTGHVWSEVSLCHPDDILWFVNRGLNGGSTTQRSTNATFSRSGDRILETNRHTTGVYAFNPLEVFPPGYIYDTKLIEENNFKPIPNGARASQKFEVGLVIGKR